MGLLIEKSNTEDLIKNYSNTLIQVTKSVNKGVIKVEDLEQWQKLKVHKMSLLYYFRKEKMELLCYKIEFSTRIRLKTIF